MFILYIISTDFKALKESEQIKNWLSFNDLIFVRISISAINYTLKTLYSSTNIFSRLQYIEEFTKKYNQVVGEETGYE